MLECSKTPKRLYNLAVLLGAMFPVAQYGIREVEMV